VSVPSKMESKAAVNRTLCAPCRPLQLNPIFNRGGPKNRRETSPSFTILTSLTTFRRLSIIFERFSIVDKKMIRYEAVCSLSL
jgi:hypothetical protein